MQHTSSKLSFDSNKTLWYAPVFRHNLIRHSSHRAQINAVRCVISAFGTRLDRPRCNTRSSSRGDTGTETGITVHRRPSARNNLFPPRKLHWPVTLGLPLSHLILLPTHMLSHPFLLHQSSSHCQWQLCRLACNFAFYGGDMLSPPPRPS